MEDSLYHLVGVILQMRFVRIQCVMTAMILLVLLIRGVYRKAKGANPYVYGFLWILPLVAVFAGKWRLFEQGIFAGCEEALWIVLDELSSFGMAYWGIALAIYLCYMIGRFRLSQRVKKYQKPSGLAMKERWIQIRISDMRHSPFTCGTLRPCIVLPEDYESRYTYEELELVLLHERMHIQCYHTFFFGLVAFVKSVSWLNPVVHCGVQAFRTDMEIFCDGKVAEQRDRVQYGKLILKSLLALQEPENVLEQVTFFFSKGECRRRIEVLAGCKGMFWKYRKRILKGVLCGVAIGAMIMLVNSRWLATRYTGIDAVLVRENVEEMTWLELPLTNEECKMVIQKETEVSLVIDSKVFREMLRKKGYNQGEVVVWYGGYDLGLGTEKNYRTATVCSLYDSNNRYLKLEKKRMDNDWLLMYL